MIDGISFGPGFCAERQTFFISTECSGSLSDHYLYAVNLFLLSSEENDTQN